MREFIEKLKWEFIMATLEVAPFWDQFVLTCACLVIHLQM